MLIHNRTKSFQLFDKCLFDIPHDSDLSFQLSRRLSWQFRIYCHCLFRAFSGYNVYFVTLTYDDYNLPRFEHEIGFRRFSFPCFDREDIRRFIRGIQQDLYRSFGVVDIDYIVCSEFGSHTARPHYHLLLFIPKFLVDYKGFKTDCDSLNSIEVHKLVVKHWSNIIPSSYDSKGIPLRHLKGWVLPNNAFGGVDKKGHNHKPLMVDKSKLSNVAIYVSKYCTKQLDFYSVPQFSNLYKIAKKNNDKDLKKSLDSCKPFLKVSLGFGSCIDSLVVDPANCKWASVFRYSADINERLYDGFWSPLYRKGTIKIPRYNLQRLLYDRNIVLKERIVSNDDGKVYHRYTYSTQFSDLHRSFIPYKYLRSLEDTRNKYYDFYNCHFPNESFKKNIDLLGFTSEDVDLLRSFKDNIDNLSMYKVVYQDRISPQHYYQNRFESWYSVSHSSYFVSDIVDSDDPYKWSITDKFVESIDYDEICLRSFSNDIDCVDLSLPYPLRFTGKESVYIMSKFAFSFYRLSSDVVRNPLENNIAPFDFSYYLFNNFPCFANYDRVIHLINTYNRYLSNQRLKAIFDKEKKKKEQIDFLYDN